MASLDREARGQTGVLLYWGSVEGRRVSRGENKWTIGAGRGYKGRKRREDEVYSFREKAVEADVVAGTNKDGGPGGTRQGRNRESGVGI